MDDVERGDVQADERVGGQHEMRCLHSSVGRVAVGERPLLADHLDVHRVRAPGRHERGRGPLAAARPVLGELGGAEGGEGHDDHDGHDQPEDLDPRALAPVGRAVDRGATRTKVAERERDEQEDEEQDRREHGDEHGVAEHLAGGLLAAVARRDRGAEEDRDEGRRDHARHDPEDQKAAAVAGVAAGGGARGGLSRH